MHFYMSAVGIALTIVAALVAGWLAWRLTQGKVTRSAHRLGIAVLAMFTTVALMTWDVVRTGIAMAELCPQAGLFVKRSVRVDGFYTHYGTPDPLKEGFEFVESKTYGNQIQVYKREGASFREDIYAERDYEIKSQYEFIRAVVSKFNGRSDIELRKSVVRDRKSIADELGHYLAYYAYPGWVDRHSLSLLTQVYWTCPAINEINPGLLREAVLLPQKGGVSNDN